MKTIPSTVRSNRGFILWVYLSLLGVGIASLAGIMSYSMTSAKRTARNNEYLATSYVAESVAEKLRSAMQFTNSTWGQQHVFDTLACYTSVLSSADSDYFGSYGFSRPIVYRKGGETDMALDPPYTGCISRGYKYQIIVTATNLNGQFHVPVTVGLELNMAMYGIFTKMAFWGPGMDLEINPGANMTLSGPVYGGGDVYLGPNSGVTLTLKSNLSSSGSIHTYKSPNDPTSRTYGTVTPDPDGYKWSNQPSLALPIGTNSSAGGTNNPSAVHAILDVPPAGEAVDSEVGTNRYYNKADLIITVTDTNIQVTGPTYNKNRQTLNNFPTASIVNTNDIFYDFREAKWAKTTAIDVGNLKAYASTNTELRALTGKSNLNTLFVVDLRSTTNPKPTTNVITTNSVAALISPWHLLSGNTYTQLDIAHIIPAFSNGLNAVTLTNGTILPDGGLTVATPEPVYVKGNYNTPLTGTNPGAIMADAISILSTNWNNYASSNTPASTRPATNTTVNAAFLAGNVASRLTPTPTRYSGGLENFPRFLEDWSGKTFTYTGSMVCLFPSQVATGSWNNASYSAPTRVWAFDTNFTSSSTSPPNSPQAIASSRGRWAILAPGATNF